MTVPDSVFNPNPNVVSAFPEVEIDLANTAASTEEASVLPEETQAAVNQETAPDSPPHTDHIDVFFSENELDDLGVSTTTEGSETNKGDIDKDTLGGSQNDIIFKAVASSMKKDGLLAADFEIGDDMDSGELLKAAGANIAKNEREKVRSEFYAEMSQTYSDDTMAYAKRLSSGIPNTELTRLTQYKQLASFDITAANADQKRAIYTVYVQDRGPDLVPSEVESLVESMEFSEDDTVDQDNKVKAHFGTKASDIEKELDRRATDHQNKVKQQIKDRSSKIEEIIASGNILGVDIVNKRQFRESVFTKNKVITAGGKDYPVSAMDEFLYRFNSDPQISLRAFLDYSKRETGQDTEKEEDKTKENIDFIEAIRRNNANKNKFKTVTKRPKPVYNRNGHNNLFSQRTGMLKKR